jgi:MoaA/NifB/PqqE/SkfB family radical SAM enzyme
MIDSFGRRIHYARISITDLCNLRCRYCMPEEGVPKKDCREILRIEDFVEIAQVIVELGIDKIRISGGEPLVRRSFIAYCENACGKNMLFHTSFFSFTFFCANRLMSIYWITFLMRGPFSGFSLEMRNAKRASSADFFTRSGSLP